MENASLNTLAWQSLKQNKLAFSSLLFIVICFFIGLFSVILSSDSSPMANEMHIELATKKPLSKIIFLEIPKQEINEIDFFEALFLGHTSKVKRIPIEKYSIMETELSYFPFQSKLAKTYSGDYKITTQTFWLGTDKNIINSRQ